MKKNLNISGGFNVNLDNVCVWIVEEESIQLQLNGIEELAIIDILLKDSKTAEFRNGHKVTINELKRIEREITEYMTK